MTSQAPLRKHGLRLAWVVFVLAVAGWAVLRGAYKFGPACDLLIVPALAAQAWLVFLPVGKHQ
jgi:hypothetical protein